MAGPPKHRESYSKGDDTINYVEYEGRYGGDDKVLQHLKMGAETAHITIHPGQPPQFRAQKNRPEAPLRVAVSTEMAGYTP
ncbi:MAG: hypothetical protein AAFV19_01915, partial [Pseudomonadota bacterium]